MTGLENYIKDNKLSSNTKFELDTFNEIKSSNQEKLNSIKIPNRYIEDWKYTNLTKILSNNYSTENVNQIEQTVDTSSSFHHIYTLNGKINTTLSDDLDIEITSISETKSDKAETLLNGSSYFKTDFANTLNLANLSDGFIIEIPKNICIEKPIKFHHHFSGDKSRHNMTNFIILNECSQVNIFEVLSSDDNVFVNMRTDVSLQQNAFCGHNVIQTTSKESLVIYTLNSKLTKDSQYKHVMVNTGALVSRSNLYFNLIDCGANANTHGLYALQDQQHHDTMSFINHAAANTESHQLYKGILDQESRGVFTGRIFIEKDSQQVNANQLNKNLILSKKAQINSRPQLEIYADDVKCCHGSTTGQLSDEELFYFESRGINKDKARKILARAFAYDIVLKIDNKEIREEIKTHLLNKEIVS